MLGSVARICCYPLVSVCEGLMETLSRETLNAGQRGRRASHRATGLFSSLDTEDLMTDRVSFWLRLLSA